MDFKNRTTIANVMSKCRVGCFLSHSVVTYFDLLVCSYHFVFGMSSTECYYYRRCPQESSCVYCFQSLRKSSCYCVRQGLLCLALFHVVFVFRWLSMLCRINRVTLHHSSQQPSHLKTHFFWSYQYIQHIRGAGVMLYIN